MADQDRVSQPANDKVVQAVPVTPSERTQRPEGLAFDVEKDADLPGVPVGDQTPHNPEAGHVEEAVREAGEGVGLAVPADPAREPGNSPGEESRKR
jgi:hypothetical protein